MERDHQYRATISTAGVINQRSSTCFKHTSIAIGPPIAARIAIGDGAQALATPQNAESQCQASMPGSIVTPSSGRRSGGSGEVVDNSALMVRDYSSISLLRIAYRTRAAVEARSSLRITFALCVSTVLRLMLSILAVALLVWPSAII